ncbi:MULTISPECIES: HAD family phosphatase [unclassified Streptomyces]|uniref:HAD family hydrolase n=1 Tax=unclassified Streptomyces TaxID=2593676 RepID=UPI00278BB4E4|nr:MULTISPECIES: HAD-IB family phosphatase [unclassified Streptomyces]
MTRLHVFDMDGTLLRNTTASLEIASRARCLPELMALEADVAAGRTDTRAFAAELGRLWRGLREDVVARAFAGAPWIGGLADVAADIRARGERSMVITMSPDFFAARLTEFGVDEVVASRFPPLPLTAAPGPAGILTPQDKVTVVDRVRARFGLDRDSCVAYGDSGSDIPLFRELRHTVAVNASPAVRALARCRYDGDDLREAHRLVGDGPQPPLR